MPEPAEAVRVAIVEYGNAERAYGHASPYRGHTVEHGRQRDMAAAKLAAAISSALAARDEEIAVLKAALGEIIERADKAWMPMRAFRSEEQAERDAARHEAWTDAADIARAALSATTRKEPE